MLLTVIVLAPLLRLKNKNQIVVILYIYIFMYIYFFIFKGSSVRHEIILLAASLQQEDTCWEQRVKCGMWYNILF